MAELSPGCFYFNLPVISAADIDGNHRWTPAGLWWCLKFFVVIQFLRQPFIKKPLSLSLWTLGTELLLLMPSSKVPKTKGKSSILHLKNIWHRDQSVLLSWSTWCHHIHCQLSWWWWWPHPDRDSSGANLEEIARHREHDVFTIISSSSEPLVLLSEGNNGGIPVAMTTFPRPWWPRGENTWYTHTLCVCLKDIHTYTQCVMCNL